MRPAHLLALAPVVLSPRAFSGETITAPFARINKAIDAEQHIMRAIDSMCSDVPRSESLPSTDEGPE